jgi:hypothetical protein
MGVINVIALQRFVKKEGNKSFPFLIKKQS